MLINDLYFLYLHNKIAYITYLIGEAIKKVRQCKNLTQEELGSMIGVQKAQISRIENGKNLTFSTIAKVFKAMGINAKLEIETLGKVALW